MDPYLFRAGHAAVPFVDVMNTTMDKSLLPGSPRDHQLQRQPGELALKDRAFEVARMLRQVGITK